MNINNQLLRIAQDIQVVLKSEYDLKPDVNELLKVIKQQVGTLLDMVKQNKNVDYDQLERAVQKAEAEIRNHVRLEQQMKLYSDSLQEKIDQLEKVNQELHEKIKAAEKRPTSQHPTRESSPSMFKKAYILGNTVYQQQQDVLRDRRSSGTQHSYNIREKVNMNSSQERITDNSKTSSSILKSQSSLLKMYNIQKLIIKSQQDKQLSQLKNKTMNQILDDSQATKKKL